MARIATTSTANSITARMVGLDTEYSYDDRDCYWYLDGDYQGTSHLNAEVSSGGKFTFSGLKSNTSYYIYVTMPITTSSGTVWVDFDTSATTTKLKINPWSWSSSNGSATAVQTQAAYSAVKSKGRLDDFSYLVWNDMVDKVWEIARAAGKSSWNVNNGKYLTYGNTKMSSENKLLTAQRFNSLRYNIGYIYPTGIEDVSKGDVVSGSYFITLTECMNEWLDTL